MNNTYTWNIKLLECIPLIDGQNNVVSKVHWIVNAISDEGINVPMPNNTTDFVPYTTSTSGVQALTFDAKNAFIIYDSLTKDTVVGWVQEAMGADAVTALQEVLDKRLEALANPPIVTPPLPWLA